MRIGDKEWRDKVAKVLRGIRRDIDRDFAKRIARELRQQQRERFGDELYCTKRTA